MANEFVARNGLISQNNSTVTGSLTVTNGITGSLFGTASWASNATSSSFAGNSLTASYLNTLNQNLTFNGNLTLNGTASISYLDVRFESASVIYSSGSNQFGDASNDTQTLYGTVSIPTGPLLITGSVFYTGSGGGTPAVNIDNVLRITRTGGAGGITIDGSTGKVTGGGNSVVYEPYNYGDASHNFNIGHATVGNFNWSVGTNSTLSSNTQLMRLTRSGSLGIRTTNPAATLDVSGSVNISGSGVQVPLQVSSGSTPLLFVSRSGNVGIGTSTPTNTLDIQSTGTGSLRISGSGGSQITLVRPTAGLTGFLRYVGTTMELGTAGADPLNLYTGNTARLAIDTSGNVGIGIGAATPSARLHVSGASSATLLEIDSPTVNNIILVSGSGDISIRKSVPTATLDISGSTLITGSLNVSSGITGSLFGTSSWASNAVSASRAATASLADRLVINSTNASGFNPVIFVSSSGDGTVYKYQLSSFYFDPGTDTLNVSNITSSLFGTASYATNAGTASYVLQAVSSSFATNASTASYIQNAQSASYVLQAVSASYSTSASNADLLDGLHASSFVLNSQTSSMTVLSASFASTASYVNNLNQNVLITGSLTVGSSSLGASENTITLGARDNGSEGGQLGFNAPGGTYTSASMIDNYQNRLRILRGTNAGSDAEFFSLNLHSGQAVLNRYTGSGAFPGSVTGILAVDSSGNILTTTAGGTGTVTQVNTSGTVNGITLTGGPITTTGTITLGGTLSNVQSSQLATSSIMIGNSSVSLGATASSLTGLTSVTATSFTGSLFGTSSWANNATTASFVTTAQTASFVTTAQTASFITGSNVFGPFGSNSVISASFAVSSSRAVSSSFATTAQTASYVLQAVSSSFATTASYVLQAVSSSFATNASTASYVLQAVSSSFASTASFVTTAQTASFVTGSNVFGPFGSNSIISASYAVSASSTLQAVTASYALTSSFSLASSANSILVINKSGATISKGMVVHLTGSNNSSDTPYVITASYENDFLSANTLGIASETIAFNNTGFITTEGVLTGVDVTGFISGQVLYLGPAGSIIGSAPVAPLHGVRLGQVVRDSPSNNGAIYVRIDNGYEIGELHDVVDTSTTSSYGDLLVRSGSVWTNSRQLTGSYRLTGSLNVTDTVQIGTVLVDHVSVNPSISGLNTIYTQSTGSYTSAFMKYSVSSGSNTRAGEFMTAWNGTNIVYTDTSTTDIGNTAGVSFISSIVSSQLRVSASCTTSGWNIKTLSTFI